MATVELTIHLENSDGEIVWWAESPDVDGFSAAAPSLSELRSRSVAALRDLVSPDLDVVERLVGADCGPGEGRGARVVTSQLVAC